MAGETLRWEWPGERTGMGKFVAAKCGDQHGATVRSPDWLIGARNFKVVDGDSVRQRGCHTSWLRKLSHRSEAPAEDGDLGYNSPQVESEGVGS